MMDLNALDRQIKEVLPNAVRTSAVEDIPVWGAPYTKVEYEVRQTTMPADATEKTKRLMEQLVTQFPTLLIAIQWKTGNETFLFK